MPQAIPQAEEVLEQLEAFLLGILESLKGIADKDRDWETSKYVL